MCPVAGSASKCSSIVSVFDSVLTSHVECPGCSILSAHKSDMLVSTYDPIVGGLGVQGHPLLYKSLKLEYDT